MSNGGGNNQTGAGQSNRNNNYPFQSAPAPQPGSLMGMQGGGQPPLAQQSQGLMGFGRGNDSTLVHMTPGEVGGLQQLAQKFGGSLTQNPHTGLPEAGFLSSILPMVAGAALTIGSGGALSPLGGAMIVGGEEALRNKDWKKGLMAGLGAYGGAGITGALGGAGAAAGATNAATSGAGGLTELNASNMSALSGSAANSGAATAATGAGMSTPGLSSNLSEMAGNATNTANVATAPAGWNTGGVDQSMANIGKGVDTLGTKQGITAFGNQVGKKGFMAAAAPAMYDAMNPAPPKVPGEAPTEYWVPGKGYNSLYNPASGGWNPGQFSTTPPGMARGGQVNESDYVDQHARDSNFIDEMRARFGDREAEKYADNYPGFGKQTIHHAAGGNVDPNAAAMARYQSMMTGPPAAAAAPPPPNALNNYLAQMQHNVTTYTPPQIAAPSQGQLTGGVMGPNGNFHTPPPGGVPRTGQPPPGGDPYNPYYNPYTLPDYSGGGGRGGRAGGGLVSLMGGGSVSGPGDGVSDSVPAMIDGHQQARLAKGEFVVPARIVSELGNGSSDAGAQRLYQMMHRVEAARKKTGMASDSGAYGNLPA